jgi:hypothetical protein
MKKHNNETKTILALIITSTLLAGCASGPSRQEVAHRQAEELAQREAAQKEELQRNNQIEQNWGKLQLGMSDDAVQALVGKFFPGWQLHASFSGSGPIMNPGSIKEQTNTLTRGSYKLVFRKGGLSDWSPRN